MKVFVTGATGLIGAHTALALLKAGHELRLLVRNKQLAQQYFSDQGFDIDDFVEADMRDQQAVEKAMAGCDAVFHAAAMVSLDPKKAEEIYQSNIQSIEAVVGTAYKLNIKNIVYVSSLGALFNPEAKIITEQAELGVLKEAYSKSKTDCEAHVRHMQEEGVPVQITYPSGTFSPNDPKLNESNHSLRTLLKVVPQMSSGIQCVDARDLALIHVKLLENSPQGDFTQYRFITAGHFYSWPEFSQLLCQVTGRPIFSPWVPSALMRFLGNLGDMVKKVYPVDTPITSESMAIVTQWPVADSSRVLDRMSLKFRSGEETFSDTISWMVEEGHINKKIAGKLALKVK